MIDPTQDGPAQKHKQTGPYLTKSSMLRAEEIKASGISRSTFLPYAMQKLTQEAPEAIIEDMIEAVCQIEEEQLLLKCPTKHSKEYVKHSGSLATQMPSLWCCMWGLRPKMQTKSCQLMENVLRVGKLDQEGTFFLCFDVLTMKITRVNATQIIIGVPQHNQHNYLFESSSPQDSQGWFRALVLSISSSYGKMHNLTSILSDPDFKSQSYVAERDFVDRCNCGDLLFFQDKGTTAILTRKIIMSNYNHVAVVLKDKDNQVFIFQSTRNHGVNIQPWELFIKYKMYNLVDKVAWSKLDLQLTQRDTSNIRSFVLQNLHKKFQITLQKLTTFESRLSAQKESYFCSQLVAALYKRLNLLEELKACSQYTPGAFALDPPLLKGSLRRPSGIVFQEGLVDLSRI